MHALSRFCEGAKLTVNMDKTVWLVGGEVATTWVAPTFEYRGQPVKRVLEFKYLGLIFTGHGLKAMVDARLSAARRAWATLLGVLV